MKKNLTRDEVIQELQRIREELVPLAVGTACPEIGMLTQQLFDLQIRVADAKVIR